MGRVITPEEAAGLSLDVRPLWGPAPEGAPAPTPAPAPSQTAQLASDDVLAEVQRLRALVRELALQVRAETAAVGERARRDAVYLAAEIAKRVLGTLAEREPGLVVRVALDALAQVRGADGVTIRANPAESELLAEALRAPHGAEATVPVPATVVADPGVARGGCLVEADQGVLDASLSGQVDTIVRAMLEEVAGQH